MIKYLLDTNICIYLIEEIPDSVVKHFTNCKFGEVAISTVTWGEICCGLNIHNGRDEIDALFAKIVAENYSVEAAEIFGKLSQDYPVRKSTLDRMIAAHALSLNAILVTNNIADFSVYQGAGLKIENWVE
ncbi:MAG: type II toxin-antitoxin system VapC family toxin [Candidatus Accumulibacter sp.]|jgi:tRNA(fMet)-specific endonuclease VapC|nr:type II toxin-antitoxin system VapC family toxin [Accumulibacter sp.]